MVRAHQKPTALEWSTPEPSESTNHGSKATNDSTKQLAAAHAPPMAHPESPIATNLKLYILEPALRSQKPCSAVANGLKRREQTLCM